VKIGILYEVQLPRPWGERSEYQLLQDALAQIELADRLGYDYAWCVEHHFLESTRGGRAGGRGRARRRRTEHASARWEQ
jgi:alkanesulfonate monooxygenase SsuD/methylene tetrahydromethanopterin reductase-like flavin-dependent oxidoreductase (luciferase family)